MLRCVGDPRRRFGEDALRVLRCVCASPASWAFPSSGRQAGPCGSLRPSPHPVGGAGAGGADKAPLRGERPPGAPGVQRGLLPPAAGVRTHVRLHPRDPLPLLHRLGAHPARGGEGPPDPHPPVGGPAPRQTASPPPSSSRAGWPTSTATPSSAPSGRRACLPRLRFSTRDRERVVSPGGGPQPGPALSEKRLKKLLSAQGPQWVGELLDLMAADNSGKQPGIGPGRLPRWPRPAPWWRRSSGGRTA